MPAIVRRLVGAVALVVFSLRVLAPEVGHACGGMPPTSSPTAVSDVAEAPVDVGHHAGDHAGHRAPAEHGHHAHGPAVTSDVGESTPADQPADPCDCSNWCCCVPTLTSPPVSGLAVAVTMVVAGDAPAAWPVVSNTVARADRLLPFATAPPRA